MSAVSNSVMPRSIALWITLREVSRSVRWPKLLQPRPTAETRRPEPPRLRICMGVPVRRNGRKRLSHCDAPPAPPQGAQPRGRRNAVQPFQLKSTDKKVRPRSDAATDGDRFWARDRDGGPDQTQAQPRPIMLRRSDSWTYPQARRNG